MQKHIWRKAQISNKSQSQPVPRWGHNCCVIDKQVIFFGGYADSNYMNDVWTYHTVTMQWKEIKTTGDIPSCRSNCSMNYDKQNNRIIVFGGGGPNKKRFNTINILDWKTKAWLEIYPKQNQPAPWERTYHSSEFIFPYLIVFGGQGVADMDDLWVFNFITLSWSQIPIDKSKVRPCARRFHSSALVGNQFFIIAGCHGKYRPLNDIYSINLSPLINNGKVDKLEWKQRKFKGSAFLSRWGQTSVVYDNKIYIFGGRFSSDLNDILVIDLDKQSMKTLKVGNQLPKPRRRHCANFIGSCMIIFGGFNGEYFNDLYYINVFQLKSKLGTNIQKKCTFIKYFNNQELSDSYIKTLENKLMPIHKGVIINCFPSEQMMEIFLHDIENKFMYSQLVNIIYPLYQGYGQMNGLYAKYRIKLPASFQQRELQYRKQAYSQLEVNQRQSIIVEKKISNSAVLSPVIAIEENQFAQFIEKRRNPSYFNLSIVVNKEYQIKVNSVVLGLSSQYFTHLFSSNWIDNYCKNLSIQIPSNSLILFEIMINYLSIDRVIIPNEMGYKQWIQLCLMADYYSIPQLVTICQQQLCLKVNQFNYKDIMKVSLEMKMSTLSMWCAEFQIKKMIIHDQNYTTSILDKKNQIIKSVYELLRFDIYQTKLQKDRLLEGNIKKKESNSTQGQKQNYQINYNQ